MDIQPGTLIVLGVVYLTIDMCIAWVANTLEPDLVFELGVRCFWSASMGGIIALEVLGWVGSP